MSLRDVAFHESGHSVAILWAFRRARWLPKPKPLLPVKFVRITDDDGNCFASDIYSCAWSEDRLAERYRALMEAQILVELSGGIAEAIYRGERRKDEVLKFAIHHCCMDTDLKRARAVLDDLRRLTGIRYEVQPFAERALVLMLGNWEAIEALASALIEDRRIEGERVVQIIDHAMTGSTSRGPPVAGAV